ncbi:MAG TPA: pyridoxal-phosphate dependent enzyme [Flavobacterium sp.]
MEVGTQQIFLSKPDVTLHVRREDLIHPNIPGNKFRKLKYNLLQAKADGLTTLLTFGGAFSNHIAAVAAAGKEHNFNTIGVIRGDELEGQSLNPTLRFAVENGMRLVFVSRDEYRQKDDPDYLALVRKRFGAVYVIPEGGTNALAVKGCEEILGEADLDFDYICCAVGTGGTISGIINSSTDQQQVLGFPALKGDFLQSAIADYTTGTNWKLIYEYNFGGYGKVDEDLIVFMNNFNDQYDVPLDPVYTGKMFYGVMDLIQKNHFPEGSRILLIHTGGLQGIQGMNELLQSKNLPLIDYR